MHLHHHHPHHLTAEKPLHAAHAANHLTTADSTSHIMNSNLWQATIKISRPGTSKADNELTDHLREHFHMGKNAAKGIKQLWGNSLDPLATNARKARKAHEQMTFEGIGGIRLAVSDERQKWLTAMEHYAAIDRQLSQDWLNSYDLWLEQERYDKNGAFRIEDYPSRENLANKLGFQFAILPMPEPNAFIRDALTDELGKQLAAEYEARVANTTESIRRRVFDNLINLISETAETLANDGPIVDSEKRKGPLAKLQEYLDRVPALNITNDPRITQLADQARVKLAYSAETLRKNETTRQLAAAQAQNIALQFGTTSRKISKAA